MSASGSSTRPTTPTQFAPGGRYTWVLDVDGYTDDAWRLSFATREAPPT